MYKKVIRLPFFNIKNKNIYYLDKYKYLNLRNSTLSETLKSKVLIDEGIIVDKKSINKKIKNPKNILVIEPHPDDAVLSAGALVLKYISNGSKIIVLNIFSRTSINNFAWKDKLKLSEDDLEHLRITESQIAIEKYLGATFVSLGLPLSTLRGKKIFSNSNKEKKLTDNISKIVVDTIMKNKIDIVVGPSAIQVHIDHLVTYDAIINAYASSKQHFNLILYEDIPYSRNKFEYSERIKNIQTQLKFDYIYLSVTRDKLDIMADLAIIYRSQFDDINRKQMLSLIKEDLRANAYSYNKMHNKKTHLVQNYIRVKGLL